MSFKSIQHCKHHHAIDVVHGDVLLLTVISIPRTVIIATDQSNARSILLYQQNLDKIKELTSHSAMGVSGPNCDLVNFTE
jgi:hypothetical protein